VLKRRRAWFRAQTDLDPRRLVFVDETGASTKMARLHGRAPGGDKAAHGGAARPLEDDHLRRRVPVVGDDRAARAGRADDGRMVRRLGRPCPRPHAPTPPRSGAATSSSSTTCPRTKVRPRVPQSRPGARTCASSRPTAPTSTRSRWPSQSSRPSCEKPPPAPPTRSGAPSAKPSTASPHAKSETTSKPQDTMHIERNLL